LIVDGKTRKLQIVTGLDRGMSKRVEGKGEIVAIPRPNLHTDCVDSTINAVLNKDADIHVWLDPLEYPWAD
jgi:hypothetical protein